MNFDVFDENYQFLCDENGDPRTLDGKIVKDLTIVEFKINVFRNVN